MLRMHIVTTQEHQYKGGWHKERGHIGLGYYGLPIKKMSFQRMDIRSLNIGS